MIANFYLASVDESGETVRRIVDMSADASLVSLVAKRVLRESVKDSGDRFTVFLAEANDAGEATKTLAEFSGDAELVDMYTRRKLRAFKNGADETATETADETATETADEKPVSTGTVYE